MDVATAASSMGSDFFALLDDTPRVVAGIRRKKYA
jgi:hypothetical protein